MRALGFGFTFFLVFVTAAFAAQTVEVLVEGLEGETLKNVQGELALPPGLVRDGQVDPAWLKRFEQQAPERVRRGLEPFGYYHPRITVSIETPQEDLFRLHVKVEPGDPVRVASVKVEIRGPGSGEEKLKDLVNAFPMKKGSPLRQDHYEEAKGALKTQALDLGYLDADFPTHEIRVLLAEAKAHIDLVLETGSQYRFGKVTFIGAPNYPESFLWRYLSFHPGEVYSHSKMAQTQLNLVNSDRFKEVSIDPQKEESQDLSVPVKIHLTSSKPKRFRFGIGYETDLGPRVSANYKDLNFRHSGHELSSELNISTRLQGLVTSYVLPGLRNIDSKTSFKLGVQHENTESYDSRSAFFETEYVRSFGQTRGLLYSLGRGSLGSVFLQTRLEDFTIGEEKGHSRLFMPGLRFSHRQYDDLIRPTRGYRFILETRGAAQTLGSDTNFLQLKFKGDILVPLPSRFSLFLRGEGGTTWCTSLEALPPSVRFFAGGSSSVRGYDFQSLGPKDSFGDVTGGKYLLVGSIELERTISKLFGIAAFYDVGNAFNSLNEIDPEQGVGLGVRLYTPVGPIRLDLARQIHVKDPRFRVYFSVGFEL